MRVSNSTSNLLTPSTEGIVTYLFYESWNTKKQRSSLHTKLQNIYRIQFSDSTLLIYFPPRCTYVFLFYALSHNSFTQAGFQASLQASGIL